MKEKVEISLVTKETLLNHIYEMKNRNCRLVQISCTQLKEVVELIYSFAEAYDLYCFKVHLAIGEEIESISSLFKPAFLYENEIHDLFGVPILDMSIDYKGHLYETAIPTPFGYNGCNVEEKSHE